MLQLFINKQFLPVVVSALTVLIIMLIRPSFLVRSSKNKACPYCLNPWWVALIVLITGGITYGVVSKPTMPKIGMYGQA